VNSPSVLSVVGWSVATVACFAAARRIHAVWRHIWTTPLLVAPALLLLLVVTTGTPYRQYAACTGWLVALLGPTTVAFAAPIHRQRALLRAHGPVILIGSVAASLTSIVTSWWLATLLGIDGSIRLSLLPRSTSTPFAMEIAGRIGGELARGALFGAGAHGVGTAKAYELGQTEGAVAALVMVMMGVLNVLCAPLLALCLSH
jgi:putative effector of murein hydrolase